MKPAAEVGDCIGDRGSDRNGWRGIIMVANTPFGENGSVDFDSIPRFTNYIADAGCEAALLRGVAAETAYLDIPERSRLVRCFADATRGRFDLIVGMSVTDRAEIVDEAKAALDAGASALNWRPIPTISVGQLIDTLSVIENAGAKKIMLQDFDIAGPGLPVEAILAAHREIEAFISVKVETIDNLSKCARIVAGAERPINLCTGWPVTGMIASFDAGIHGFMPSSLAPLMQHIYWLHRSGNRPRAVELFESLAPFHEFMSETLGRSIAVNKLLRKHEGIFTTDKCRHPEAWLDGPQRKKAEALIEAAADLQERTCER